MSHVCWVCRIGGRAQCRLDSYRMYRVASKLSLLWLHTIHEGILVISSSVSIHDPLTSLHASEVSVEYTSIP